MYELSTNIGGHLFTCRVSDRIARNLFRKLVKADPNCGCRQVETGRCAPPLPRPAYAAVTALLDTARGKNARGLWARRRLPKTVRIDRRILP